MISTITSGLSRVVCTRRKSSSDDSRVVGECPITLDNVTLDTAAVTPDGHIFDKEALAEHLRTSKTDPNTRGEIDGFDRCRGKGVCTHIGPLPLLAREHSKVRELEKKLEESKNKRFSMMTLLCAISSVLGLGVAVGYDLGRRSMHTFKGTVPGQCDRGDLLNIEPKKNKINKTTANENNEKFLNILRENKADNSLDKNSLNSLRNNKPVNIPDLLLKKTGKI